MTIKLIRKGDNTGIDRVERLPRNVLTIKTLTATGGIMDPTMSVIPTMTRTIWGRTRLHYCGKEDRVIRITNAMSSMNEPPRR